MVFSPSPASAASGWIPLLYDTVVVLLTIYRVVPVVQRNGKGHILRTFLQDGLLYYGYVQYYLLVFGYCLLIYRLNTSVIFSVNLVLTIMIPAAPPGIQNITAQ